MNDHTKQIVDNKLKLENEIASFVQSKLAEFQQENGVKPKGVDIECHGLHCLDPRGDRVVVGKVCVELGI